MYLDYWTKRSSDVPPPRIPLTVPKLEASLENYGFLRRIAGEADFRSAVAAVLTADRNGLGLLVSGTFGVGKSKLLAALYRMYRDDLHVDCVYFNLREGNDVRLLMQSLRQTGPCSVFNKHVFLDDMGAENNYGEYGHEIKPVALFLKTLYERGAELVNMRLFASTNYDEAGFADNYGGQLHSRTKARCVPFKMLGPDKRQWTLPSNNPLRISINSEKQV